MTTTETLRCRQLTKRVDTGPRTPSAMGSPPSRSLFWKSLTRYVRQPIKVDHSKLAGPMTRQQSIASSQFLVGGVGWGERDRAFGKGIGRKRSTRLREPAVAVPADVSVTGFDDVPTADFGFFPSDRTHAPRPGPNRAR